MRSDGVKQGLLLLGLLIFTRVALLLALYQATDGREFTSDAETHFFSAANPEYILLGTSSVQAHFPPLLPPILAIFITPWRWIFSDFVALRIAFASIECVAWPVVWSLIVRVLDRPLDRIVAGLTLVLAPIAWMSSIVMAQEDVLHLIFSAGICHLVLSRRWAASCFLAGLAAVSAKVFYLVPIFVISALACRDLRRFVLYGLAGAAPIMICYCVAGFFWWKQGLGFPLGQFEPSIGPTQSIWLLLHEWTGLSAAHARLGSTVLSSLVILVSTWILFRFRPLSPERINAAWGIVTTAVLCTFYMTMGEYFLIIIPPLLLAVPISGFVTIVLAILSVPWAVNYFYGVQFATVSGGTAQGSVFVRLYHQLFSWARPIMLKQLTLAAFVVLSWTTWLLAGKRLAKTQVTNSATESY